MEPVKTPNLASLALNIPTIRDNLAGYKSLYNLFDQCLRHTGARKVQVRFVGCGFLGQNAVVFLTALLGMLIQRNFSWHIAWETCEAPVLRNLKRNGFAGRFGLAQALPLQNAIQIRKFHTAGEEEAVVGYLQDEWLNRGWLNMSEELAGAIIGNVWEIFANSFEHSSSTDGLYVCGQHFPNNHTLSLSLVDFGVGIPGRVRRHLNIPQMGAADAFRWALQRGNSTRLGRPGGLGLHMLRDFITINHGEMSVYSRDGYFRWFGHEEHFGTMPSDFRGTLVNLTLKCDDRFYFLGETSESARSV